MPPKKTHKGDAAAPKRQDSLSRHYPKLQDGSSVFGLEEFDDEARAHVIGNRSDWKFYALCSFCHTFRAVLMLPTFTGDELERSLVDPAKHVLTLEILLRLIDPPVRSRGEMDKNRLAVDEWEARLARKIEALAEETDYFESDYPDPDDETRGHPFNGGRTFFDLTPRERLDVLYALGEERLEDDPEGECGAEVWAMAAHNARVADTEEEGHHPEAHGDPIGVDSDNRQYFACGDDLRVYRWEKPKANAFTQPAWGTVCVGLKETMAFADSLKGGKRNSKDYLLWEYLTETHLPPHVAALEREDRAKRAEEKAAEDAEKRRLAKEAYEGVDRKRSGRIAQKAAEEEERKRLEEEAVAKRNAVRAAAAAKEDARQKACWRWMLLPPRLRPAEVPEGMNPAHSEAARSDPGAQQAFELANSYAANPRGDACVGKRLDVYWDDDQTWYRGVVRAHDRGRHTHEVYYPEDDVTETVRLAAVRKRWIPDGWDESDESGAEPPEVFEPGLEHRGVKVDGSATVLFMRRPETVGKQEQQQEQQQQQEEEEEDAAALRDPEPRSSDRSADETMDIERREGSMDGYDNDGYDNDGYDNDGYDNDGYDEDGDDEDGDDGYGGVDELKAERDGDRGSRKNALDAVGSAAEVLPPAQRSHLEEEEEEEEEEEGERRLSPVGVTENSFQERTSALLAARQEKRRAKEELKRKRQATLERAREKLARLRDQEAEERAAPTEAGVPEA